MSSACVTWLAARLSPEMAETAIATSCNGSARLLAVTTMSVASPPSSAKLADGKAAQAAATAKADEPAKRVIKNILQISTVGAVKEARNGRVQVSYR
jgi:hypothetical protein